MVPKSTTINRLRNLGENNSTSISNGREELKYNKNLALIELN